MRATLSTALTAINTTGCARGVPMNYEQFFKRFGGSARTKNIGPNRRPFALPGQSGLPREFIRLCPWEMEYLFAVARHARLGIVETGRFNGGSCFLLTCAAPDVPVYSIDTAPQNDELLLELFRQHGVGRNVRLIVGDSHDEFPQIGAVDLVFIDGDHSYEGCMRDLVNWYDHLAANGHLILHDSYCGPWRVQEAIIDFMSTHHDLQVLQSPFIGASYWNYPAGSIAHLIKRAVPLKKTD
jgi:hypothetical protein